MVVGDGQLCLNEGERMLCSESSSVTPQWKLPCYDGFIQVELSHKPVSYHVTCCFPEDMGDRECHALVMSTCRIACMVADVIRGRVASSILQRTMSVNCMKRLVTMSYLLEIHMKSDHELRENLCFLPTIPHWMNGMFVSQNTLEALVHLSIGRLKYWVTLVFKRSGSRWVCIAADLG